MFTRKPRLIDDSARLGLDEYPFRLQQSGVEWVLEALVKLLMLPLAISWLAGFIALVIASLKLIPQSHAGAFITACWLIGYAAVLWLLWTWQESRYYDRAAERFCIRKRRLGRWKGQCWDAAAFSGISVGYKLGRNSPGGYPVVRLHAKTEGFLLDGFLIVPSLAFGRKLGARLAELSGLPLLEERNTGPQDDLNDIRQNAWLLQRQARAGTRTSSRGFGTGN